jgi:Ca2+-binding RTX toxin-like protein
MMTRHFCRIVQRPLSRLFKSGQYKFSKRGRLQHHSTLQAERLEPRNLLAVSPISLDTALSQLVIRGDSVDDTVVVSAPTADTVHVSYTASGVTTQATFARSAVQSIDYSGSFGNDLFENKTDIPSRAVGGIGDDVLIGGLGVDALYGTDGNDELRGNGGNDLLFGQDGTDLIYGGDGDDELTGGLDNDYLYGGSGHDRLLGNEGDDELTGDQGNDELLGLDGNDLLQGSADNDTLSGGFGNDYVLGDAGNDTIRGQEGNDTLLGGSGEDDMAGGTGDDLLNGDADNDLLVGNEGDDYVAGDQGNDRLLGSDGKDSLNGGIGNDYLDGGADADRLFGSAGDDELTGQDGNDHLYGQAGNDLLTGGVGNDVLGGGDDHDTINGNEGNDRLYGQSGNDNLLGWTGHDLLLGGAGDDILDGREGQDLLLGDDGNDSLDGGADGDVLVGGQDIDLLNAGTGNDVAIGGLGADSLNGEWGDDILVGGMTSFDDDFDRLRDLLTAWTADSTYATRIGLITDELFAAHLVPGATVLDDGAKDNLTGGDNDDWFFQTGSMSTYVPSDVHHHEEEEAPEGDHDHGQVIVNQPPDLEGFALISSLDAFIDREPAETIKSSLPHVDNPVLQREHLSLFETVRYDQITHYAIHSGNWSDPGIWHDGVVPSSGARVLIPLGVEVRVNGVIPARLATIRVDGTLSFATAVNTELRVDTIVVAGTGTFEMGTAAAPIQPNVTARLLITNDGPIDRTADPFGITRGLLSHGAVSIHGAEVSSHVALAAGAQAGASILALKSIPNGWKVGDTVVIAATTAGTEQNEVRQIVAVSANLLWLSQALTYDHVAPGPAMDVHVANVTRNAVIESESAVVDRRGHVMFMHNRDVDIAYAGFYRLGRTDKSVPINDPVVEDGWSLQPLTGTNPRARYSVHFHRTGTIADGNPSVIRGSAVVDSPGWGFVNHSSYVDMLNNVAFDVHGAAFATEVGDEVGSFRNNIAIGSVGSGESINSRIQLQDFGHQGDGFWFQGGGIEVTDNISAGNDEHAFVYYTRGLIEGGVRKMFHTANLPYPEIADGAEMIEVEQVPLFEFARNTGYASTIGLATRYQLRDATHPHQQSLIADSTFWNNTLGIDLSYAQRIVVTDVTVAHAPGTWPQVGIAHNAVTKNIQFNNVTVTGYSWGIDVPRLGSTVINGGYFANRYDIVIQTGLSSDRNVLINGPIQLGALGLLNQAHIYMRPQVKPLEGWHAFLFSLDVVTLDYGPYDNRRLYYTLQDAAAVPVTEPMPDVPEHYIGLTNQQLWDLYSVAFGGEVAPANAQVVPDIIGLVAL